MSKDVTRIEWNTPTTPAGSSMPATVAKFNQGQGVDVWFGWSLTLSTNFVYFEHKQTKRWVSIPRDQCIIHGVGSVPVGAAKSVAKKGRGAIGTKAAQKLSKDDTNA